MKNINLKTLAMLVALSGTGLFMTTVNASGSFSPSANAGDKLNYNAGKRVFLHKISCDTCPLPSKKLNKSAASEVIQLLNSREDLMKLLNPQELTSAVYYLKKRHKLS